MDIDLNKEKRHESKKKAEVQNIPNRKNKKRDKRHEIRKDTAQSQKTSVTIPLPFPKGVKIVKEVTDLSEKGLAFKMAREEGFLLPGTTIKNLVICYSDTKVEKPSAEVMYAIPTLEDGSFKIGIKFTDGTNKRLALGRKALTPAVRPYRFDLIGLNHQNRIIKFKGHNGQQYSGTLKNISTYGLAFELYKSEKTPTGYLKLSEMLDQFQVIIGGETVYDGKATIANLREINGKTIVGVSLTHKSIDVQKIIDQEFEGKSTALTEWAPTLLNIERVNHSVKAIVADMRFFLEEVKARLDLEEQKARNEGLIHREKIEKTVLLRFEQPVFNCLDRLIIEFDELVQNLDEEQHTYHREYFQKQLGGLIWLSPFAKRSYLKPLGYAGDYEMMHMIYRAPYEGETWFAKLLNKYFCNHIPPSQAIRNRLPFLLEKINRIVEKKMHGQKGARIMSVACGPAQEIVEFIKNNESSDQTEITLVDIEPEALYYCQDKVLEAKAHAGRNTRINIYYLPLHELIKESVKVNELESQDLIYSVGLFDYLSDRVSIKAISTLYKLLSPNGLLIIGNYDPNYHFKWFLAYGAEWFKFYRTQADLLRVAREAIGEGPKIHCETEPTGIDNFLIVQR